MTKDQPPKILVVEDEVITAMDIVQTLEGFGYTVVGTASSAEEAIEKTSYLLPDLVLMDIALEGTMDGVAAAKRIKAHFDLPIIYLTAHSDASTMEQVKFSNPYGLIFKPFDEDHLRSVLKMALDQ